MLFLPKLLFIVCVRVVTFIAFLFLSQAILKSKAPSFKDLFSFLTCYDSFETPSNCLAWGQLRVADLPEWVSNGSLHQSQLEETWLKHSFLGLLLQISDSEHLNDVCERFCVSRAGETT